MKVDREIMADINRAFKAALNYQIKGEISKAEAIYLSILKQQGNHSSSLINLGVIYQAKGEIEKAVGFYKLALGIQPDNVIIAANLCRALEQIDRLKEAVYFGKKALLIKADLLDIALNVGDILLHQGKLPEALKYFDHVLKISPTNAEAHRLIAEVLARQNRLLEAKQKLEEGLTINPEDWMMERLLVVVNRLLNREKEVSFVWQGIPIKFEINQKNMVLAFSHVKGNFYELKELEIIKKNANKKQVFVDIGANAGNHLIYFSKIIEAAKVIPIEFHPETIELLKKNILLNGIENADLSKLGYAVGKSRGEFLLAEHPANDLCLTEVFVSDRHNNSYQPCQDSGQIIKIMPLDELIDEKVDFIKIDVEGFEIDVLSGAKNIFLKSQPDALVEVKKINEKKFMIFLEKMGYWVVEQINKWSYSNFYIQPMAQK